MGKRKSKPASPEQIALRRAKEREAERVADRKLEWGINTEVLERPMNDDIDTTTDNARAVTLTARRMDAFGALQDSMSMTEYLAARRLQTDLTLRNGEGDKGRDLNKVDNPGGMNRTDSMIAAAERIEAVFAMMGGHDQWLLTELAAPSPTTRLRFQRWREVVAYITGEDNDRAQAGAVRGACRNLSSAYGRIDNGLAPSAASRVTPS